MLQERWRRGHYQVHHIPLPSPSLASSTDKEQVVSVVATSPWRTLVIYRPIPSVSPIRLVSVEHTRGTSQSLSIPVEPSVYSLQDYAAVNSANRNYTVVYNLYQYDYAYTWVWHRGHEHPLAIPSLRNRCCRPQTLIDHWLLVLVKFDSCSPDDSVPIYLIDLSQYTETETEKDTNEAESVIPINIKGGCVTCHVQSTDELSWRIFTGMHRSDRFHWQLWEVFLPNRSAEDTSTRQERTVLVASGCIPEPEPLSAFSNAVTYMDTCHSVIVDWRPEFSTTCQYSRYDLTGETPLTNLWLTDRQYSLDWHHCRAPARRTLSSTLFIDQQAGQVRMDTDKLVSDMNRQLARNRNAYLCRVAGALRIAGSVSRGWYLVEEPNQHCRNSDVLETKEQGDRYRILWQLPLTLTNRLHHHACATHVCSVENSHSGIVRSNSDGMHVKSNDQPILTLLDIAGACCQSSLIIKSMFPHSSNEYKNLWSRIRQFISKYS
ncbi:hypothetical protein BDF19DRAFT_438018 [Syncephalis fuscata]|nr:hypothetical protein BDF19DRAFT_438018 [Syncephalis fuscata]